MEIEYDYGGFTVPPDRAMISYAVLITAKRRPSDSEEAEIARLSWKGMTFDQFTKWRWYFEYRACLLQVQNPRAHVRLTRRREAPDTRTALNIAQNRLTACRSTLTKHLNKVDKAREQWRISDPMGLTSIEDIPNWPKVVAKTVRLKHEKLDAELTVQRLLKSNT
jgi:hypothetical protein